MAQKLSDFLGGTFTGSQGTQGIQGPLGLQGTQGTNGQAASQGTQGTQGAFGVQGSQGIQGVDGSSSSQGTQGAQGSLGVQGSQGIQGTVGSTSAQGTQGAQGPLGVQGSQGTQGTQGVQGTEATNFVVTATAGTTYTANCASGNIFDITLSTNTSISFINVPTSGNGYVCVFKITQGVGNYSVTWPSSVKWSDGVAPTLSSATNEIDVFTLFTGDGGSNWYGFISGQDLR